MKPSCSPDVGPAALLGPRSVCCCRDGCVDPVLMPPEDAEYAKELATWFYQQLRHLDSKQVFVSERNPAPALARDTGCVFPKKFAPPSAASTPDELFPQQATSGLVARFISRRNPAQALVYTDGSCLDNGKGNAQAGWAFVTRLGPHGAVRGRLEERGPFGEKHGQTSNRAELRAVLGALRFRHWAGEGFSSLVVATDSMYVVEGATRWARNWVRNGWKTSVGRDVKNRDLWEALLGEIERWDSLGLRIRLWRIPRALNQRADREAKQGAGDARVPERYRDVSGSIDI